MIHLSYDKYSLIHNMAQNKASKGESRQAIQLLYSLKVTDIQIVDCCEKNHLDSSCFTHNILPQLTTETNLCSWSPRFDVYQVVTEWFPVCVGHEPRCVFQ